MSACCLRRLISPPSATLWPPCPFRVAIPNRRDQYIIVTKNDRKDHGTQAKELAIRVCSQMIDWITKIPHGRRIEKRHWEHESYGLHFATKYSIFMELAPTDPDGDRYSDILNRELAYSAMVELRTLLNQYGAMQGELEFYAVNSKRAIIAIYIFEWPPEMQTGRRVDSRRDSQWDDGG